jgi:glycosyltransferase involved in cell wall biosynthesis
VTYITVVRNGSATLGRTIESVQRQTYDNVEHIILDGASTDGTLNVVKGYADRIDYFASEPDHGLYDALNKAIPLARGDLICVINSDDWLEPDAAQRAVSKMEEIVAPTLLLTGAAVCRPGLDEKLDLAFEWYPALVHPGCYFTCADDCHNAIYATRSAYERSGPYNSTYAIAGDFDWIMRSLDSGVRFIYSDVITMNYVMGGISSDPLKHERECLKTMHRRFPALSSDEVLGLHHTFFFLPVDAVLPGRPDDRTAFLRRLLLQHAGDNELLQAIAWAVIHRHARHEEDVVAAVATIGVRPAAKHIVKHVLRDHPRLYRVAQRIAAAEQRR